MFALSHTFKMELSHTGMRKQTDSIPAFDLLTHALTDLKNEKNVASLVLTKALAHLVTRHLVLLLQILFITALKRNKNMMSAIAPAIVQVDIVFSIFIARCASTFSACCPQLFTTTQS